MRSRRSSRFVVCAVVWAALALQPPADAGETESQQGRAPASSEGTPAGAEPQPRPVAETYAATIEERIAQLEQQLAMLAAQLESESAERVAQDAEAEAQAADEETRPEDREFLEGALALQKLNPEITFSADILPGVVLDGSRFYATEMDRSSLGLRGASLHIQHVLDPFSLFKSAFHVSPEHGLGLEEVYVSWFGLARSLSLTAGRFRQGFGVLNRWHEHDLDQTQHPLALRLVLGDEGLVGNGIALKWLTPRLWAHANELSLEVVDGDDELLFAGRHFTRPATLLHLKNYYDLDPDTYLELGMTGVLGFNNRRGVPGPDGELVDEPWRRTVLAGADLTLHWQPRQRARYSSFTWRSEAYLADRQLAPADSTAQGGRSWGLYSYVQSQLSPRVFVGVRGDVALPTERESSRTVWGVAPYLTFWQSEFVYLRLEYQHTRRMPYTTSDGAIGRRTDNRVLLQVDFAAGPHKHEKY